MIVELQSQARESGSLASQVQQAVNWDNTVSFQNLTLQIERVRWRATLAGC
jgi:hypothetical protein